MAITTIMITAMIMTIITLIIKREKLNKSKINYFREILENRKIHILKNIHSVNTELKQLTSCELNDEGDYAATFHSSTVDTLIVQRQEEELRSINHALNRVETGQYGICDMCNCDISFQRLSVKPHAIYCIECREIIEKEKAKK